jgi:DNA-binding NarL/FixJ family response regulator
VIRTVIIEDEPEIRAELASSLGKEPDLEVVGTFATAEAAMVGLARTNPDVVVTDIRLSGATGIDLIRHFAPQLRAVFLVLTTFDDDELVFGALEAGASGYLLKRSVPGDIAGAVRELHQGGSPMTGSIARKVVAVFRKSSLSPQEALSARENQLLERIAQGRSYKECAFDLTISVDTVRTHIRRIYRKLHVRSRHEAVAKLRGDMPKGKPPLRR